jgi:hypothetical protein
VNGISSYGIDYLSYPKAKIHHFWFKCFILNLSNMKNKSLKIILLSALVTGALSCTKLDEKVLDESSSTGLTPKQVADGLIAPVYAQLPSLFQHTRYFTLQEISTDEAILPYRGGTDWGDNGIYISLHKHETVPPILMLGNLESDNAVFIQVHYRHQRIEKPIPMQRSGL